MHLGTGTHVTKWEVLVTSILADCRGEFKFSAAQTQKHFFGYFWSMHLRVCVCSVCYMSKFGAGGDTGANNTNPQVFWLCLCLCYANVNVSLLSDFTIQPVEAIPSR